MSRPTDTEKRTSARHQLSHQFTEAEIDGHTVQVQVFDLSEGGVRIVLPSELRVDHDDELSIAIGKLIPNLRGKVRWVATDPEHPDQSMAGVQFESFVLRELSEDQIQGVIDAWREFSEAANVFDGFLRIVEIIDVEILEQHVDDISDAIYSVTVWLEKRLGALNLWRVVDDPQARSLQQLVSRHEPELALEQRHEAVDEAFASKMTVWRGDLLYLYGEGIVVEFLGDSQGKIDLLQNLTLALGKRITFWSKLLMKNIALQVLGEELDRIYGRS